MSNFDEQIDVIEVVLTSAVANAGTFAATYPANRTIGSYARTGHEVMAAGARLVFPADFTISFGASSATITNATGASIPAGTVRVGLKRSGSKIPAKEIDRARDVKTVMLNLGTPATSDVDGVFTAFTGAAGAITLNGALASGGVVTFDVPRNIIVDSGGADTAVLTFVGTDEYGAAMSEAITLNGTTAVVGLKAFKTITSCTSSASIANGAFAGSGVLLGLPVFLEGTGHIVKEIMDGAAATAGTTVAGVTTEATTTTGDVRGTYSPNSAPNGSRSYKIAILTEDPSNLGIPQA